MPILLVDLTPDENRQLWSSLSPSMGGDPTERSCLIISRSQNAMANASDLFVDRLSKLMRGQSCSPEAKSYPTDMSIKGEIEEQNLVAMPTGCLREIDIISAEPYLHHRCFPEVNTCTSSQSTKTESYMQSTPKLQHTPSYSSLQLLATISDSIHLLQPKHIYRTSCNSFRVQIGKGVKANPHHKFSRNIRDETEALWLCEIALLFIDCPPNLSEMLCNGNYKCLLQRNLVYSADHYLASIATKIEEMKAKRYLKCNEAELAAAAMKTIQTQSLFSTEAPQSFVPRHLFPTSTLASLPSKSIIASRKKRIRHRGGGTLEPDSPSLAL